MTSGAAPRVRRDVARNRARLIEAGRQLFATDGLEVALDDVARAAGLSRTSLARHFPTRQHLVAALWEADVVEIEELAADVRHRPDGFLILFDHISATQVDRRALHPTPSQIEGGELTALVIRIRAAVESTLPASIDAGNARPDLTVDDALIAIAMCTLIITEEPSRARRTAMWTTARRLLLPGLMPRGWSAATPIQ